MRTLILLSFIVTSLCSCSTFQVTKVDESNRNSVKGLRFFMPQAYLLVAEKDLLVDGLKTIKESDQQKVTSTQKMAVARKELRCSIIYLPNPQREYAISTNFGEVPKSIRLEDGWKLTGYNDFQEPVLGDETLHYLSGTEGLVPGIYAIEQEEGQIILKKVEILL